MVVQRMTDPNLFDPFAMQPEPVAEFTTPDHNASSVVLSEKPPTVRERLMANAGGNRRRGRPSNADKEANAKKAAPPVEPGKYVQPMQDFYEAVGIFALPFHPRFGMTMLNPAREASEEEAAKGTEPPSVARNCALAWDAAAQQSEGVRRALDRFLTVGVLGALVTAHVPIFMALAAGTKLDPNVMMENFKRTEETDTDGE
jgi:hypothetical protein